MSAQRRPSTTHACAAVACEQQEKEGAPVDVADALHGAEQHGADVFGELSLQLQSAHVAAHAQPVHVAAQQRQVGHRAGGAHQHAGAADGVVLRQRQIARQPRAEERRVLQQLRLQLAVLLQVEQPPGLAGAGGRVCEGRNARRALGSGRVAAAGRTARTCGRGGARHAAAPEAAHLRAACSPGARVSAARSRKARGR